VLINNCVFYRLSVYLQEVDSGVLAFGQHQINDNRLLPTHQSITESTLSLIVNPSGHANRGHHFYLEDLLNDTTTGLGFVLHSRVEQLLRHSELPVHQSIWNRLESNVHRRTGRESATSGTSNDAVFSSLQEGIQHVADNSRFILIAESSEAAYAMLNSPGCRLTVHDQYFPVAQYYFVVATTSISPSHGSSGSESRSSRRQSASSSLLDPRWLIRQLDDAVTRLHDAGIIQQLYDKWWTSSDGSRGCDERTTSGRNTSTGRLGHPQLPAGSQPQQPEDDWRARERIFFESPLQRQKTTSTTVAAASLMTSSDTIASSLSGLRDDRR
jgi:hypothetical protein